MKARTVLVACALALPIIPLRAQQTFYGDHVITGELRVGGDFLDLGTSSTNSGVTWQYNDDGTNSTLSVTASQPTAGYLWEDNSVGALVTKMKLDGTNALTLFVADGTSMGIFLNPGGVSSFSGSLLVNGTNNLMPNQTLSDSNSVLTRRLADDRYLQTGLSTFAVGGSNFVVSTNGRVGVGTSSPTYDVSLDGEANQSIGVERASSGVGKDLTISAGEAGAGSDLAGGSLILAAGISTGAGDGEILFQTPQQTWAGTYTTNPLATRMRIANSGSVGIGPAALSGYTGNRAVLDVSAGGGTLMLGGDGSYTTNGTRTDAVQKRMQILMPPFYTNLAGLPVLAGVVNSNAASLYIGTPTIPLGRAFTSLHFGTSLDPTNATSNGRKRLSIFGDGKIIVNETKTNTADFQIMGAQNTNLLYVAVGTNRIGIGTNAPAATLHVAGGAQVDGALQVQGALRIVPQGDLAMGVFTNQP